MTSLLWLVQLSQIWNKGDNNMQSRIYLEYKYKYFCVYVKTYAIFTLAWCQHEYPCWFPTTVKV